MLTKPVLRILSILVLINLFYPEYLVTAKDITAPKAAVDSIHSVELPGILVTSGRLPYTLTLAPSAVSARSVNTANTAVLPGLTGTINGIPGIRASALGNPFGKVDLNVRGFYGGTQTQYLVVSLDGIPLNECSSGMFDISGLSATEIGGIEVVKGPVTSQWGDFGFGGILAIQSKEIDSNLGGQLQVLSASHDSWGAAGRFEIGGGHWGVALSPASQHSLGWRAHSEIESQRFVARFAGSKSRHRWSLTAYLNTTDEEFPGALTREQFNSDPAQAASNFSGMVVPDQRDQTDFLVGAASVIALSPDTDLRPLLYVKGTSQTSVQSISSSLHHESDNISVGGEIGATSSFDLFNRRVRLFGGISMDLGTLSTIYSSYPADIQSTPITDGDGKRFSVAPFVQSAYDLSSRLVLSFGLRFDFLSTTFERHISTLIESPRSEKQSESAFSPKFALTFRPHRNLSSYVSVSSAFKAPTLLHLYDSPPIFYIGPDDQPNYLLISNSKLLPLRGVNYEAGLRYSPNGRTHLTVDGYWFEVKEEIDFDPSTFRYVNSGRSRHRGIEIMAVYSPAGFIEFAANGALTNAVFKNDPYLGKQLNGVPKHEYGAQVKIRPHDKVGLVGRVDGKAGQYLDQNNAISIGDYALTSIAVIWENHLLDLSVGISNLLDKEYAVDGYVGLFGEERLYPGAPRTMLSKVTLHLGN